MGKTMAPQQVAVAILIFVIAMPLAIVLNAKDKGETDYTTEEKVALWLTPFAAAFAAGIVAYKSVGIGFIAGLVLLAIPFIIFYFKRIK